MEKSKKNPKKSKKNPKVSKFQHKKQKSKKKSLKNKNAFLLVFLSVTENDVRTEILLSNFGYVSNE